MFLKKRKAQKPVKKPANIDDGIPSLDDLFVPDGLQNGTDMLQFNYSQYARVFQIKLWPRQIHLGWLNEIFSVGDIDLAVYVDPVPDRNVIRQLTKKMVEAESQLIVEQNRGAIARIPELRSVIKDLEVIREAIQYNVERMLNVSVFITVHAASKEELDSRCNVLEGILARKSVRLGTALFVQKEAFKSSLPIADLDLNVARVRNMTTGGTMAMLPVSDSNLSHAQGAWMGFSASGNPVFFDPFIGPPQLVNPHVAVFGTSGSGKSVTLKALSARSVLNGVRVLVLDPEGEYRKMAGGLCDGEIITIRPGYSSGINPLSLREEWDEDLKQTIVDLSGKVADTRALIAALVRNSANRPLSAREMSVLEESIREEYAVRGINSRPDSLYEQGGQKKGESYVVGKTLKKMPTLTDLHDRLMTKKDAMGNLMVEELCIILKPFLRGNTLGMFDCESTVDLDAPFVVIDLSRITEEFTKFYATFVILNWAWSDFAIKYKGNKFIVVDEAWMFMKYPESAVFLETWARRGRKHFAGLVLASQFVEEFLAREEGRAVINNCASKILLGQQPTVAETIIQEFKMPAGLGQILGTFRNGECLFTMGNQTAYCKIEILPHEMQFFATGAG